MATQAHPADAQAFIAHIRDGGYRPNRYRVTLVGIEGLKEIDASLAKAASEDFSFMCTSAQLPSSTLGVAEAAYFGRPIKLAGDKTFNDWTCEVYYTKRVRDLFEKLHDNMLGFETNLASAGYSDPLNYYFDARVETLDREGNVGIIYDMKQIFPMEIGEVALSYENNNQIARFPVTFAVNYFVRADNGGINKRLASQPKA